MAAATVSISQQAYEVFESDGVVNVVVTKSGDFFEPIQGTLTTVQGSAGGKNGEGMMCKVHQSILISLK